MVPGVLIVGAEATVRDNFRCADQSNPLYLQIALTIETPGTEYIRRHFVLRDDGINRSGSTEVVGG